ncbi:hypothetical protein [Halorhodospira abdelmalekii]|uniref:hypothetical protein n=1 Tax=Halorhodospira abdelmalekii TaxID=421629 RepID=UPI001F5BC72F|nr:hypothetical protein [Halorhodospira abdelmalekii]
MQPSDEWTRWTAPAKVNLFLHIRGRRADGYHELQTAFQLLDFGDEVWLRPRRDGQVVRHYELPGVAPADDLTVRAARALQATLPGGEAPAAEGGSSRRAVANEWAGECFT